jgi:antirestriction protein ArdC
MSNLRVKATDKRTEDAPRRDYHQELTDSLLKLMEEGKVPWERPFDPSKSAGPQAPMNPTTGKAYRGVNTIVLGINPLSFLTEDPRWMTYKQAINEGWQVQKGAKSATVFYYKILEVEDTKANGDEVQKRIPMLKAFSVFHASQIDGIPPYFPADVKDVPWRRPEAVQTILDNSQAVLRIGGPRAYYSPSTDHIQLPEDGSFVSPEAWSAVAMHELGHWTGHKDRLNRDLAGGRMSHSYAREELRAELASFFIGSELGIPVNVPNHASYLQSWIQALKEDKREIFRASSDAQKISDFCLSFHQQWKASKEKQAKATDELGAETAPEVKARAEQNAIVAKEAKEIEEAIAVSGIDFAEVLAEGATPASKKRR